MQQIEEMADRLMMISQGKRVLYGTVEQVRRQYATGAVWIKASGDLSMVSGIERIEQKNGRYELYPAEGISPQALLHQLATTSDVMVEQFEVALPSLDDIFVRLVQEKQR